MLNYKNAKTYRKLLKYQDIREYYLNSCTLSTRYGLEYERISLDGSSKKSADYNLVEKIIKNFANIKSWGILYDDETIIGAMGENSSVSLEPGCQFELSLEAKENIVDIEKNVREITSLLDRIAKFHNVEFLPYGITPKSTYQNINIVNKKRYEIMADHLPHSGKFAPVMMRETAGAQLNVDYSSELDAVNKIKLLNFISPFLTGFFANSPIRNNKLTNYKSFRALAWKYTGDNRCGIFYKSMLNRNGASFNDYIDAILDVPMLFFERGGQKIVLNGKITFGEFLNKGYGDYFATLEDYILHSSLCFPDVRLKKCIEIRNHDCQNIELTLALCAFYKGILNSDHNEIFGYFNDINPDDIEQMGFLAAKFGTDFKYKNFDAKSFVKTLFKIACNNLNEYEKHYLEPAFELLDEGMCVADKILNANITNTEELCKYLNTNNKRRK